MEDALGIVLAGGQGRRMGVLCEDRPKPLLPFAGRFSVVDFSLSNCINSGVSNLAALTDYKHQQAAEYFKKWKLSHSGLNDLSILPPRVNSYRGTADAVYQNLDFLNRSAANKVLILAGDHIYKMDYRKMLAFHEKMNADVTVAVIQVPLQEAHRFGTCRVDAVGRVEQFIEKSPQPLSSLASMGIYIFNKDILTQRLIEDAGRSDSPHDFGYAILPGMVTSHDRVFAFEFSGYWQDIGTVEAYYKTSMELLAAEPSFSVNNHDWPAYTIDKTRGEAEISKGGKVTNSLLSPGCKIEGWVENSILSPGVYVGEQAVVRNSIIMANTGIGDYSIIDRCILDENVSVGKFCYAGFEGSSMSGNRDVTVVGRDATVPPHTGIGRNVRVHPNVTASDFITELISSGTTVSSLKSNAGDDNFI